MDKSAVEKAKRRLAKAESSLAILEKPHRGHETFLEPWTDFLLALGSIYTVLEQGSKTTPQSRQWFGRKKRERREDPLLQYLHQARNADEHGIEPVTKFKPGSFTVSGDASALESAEMSEDGLSFSFTKKDGEPWPKILVANPQIHLAAVSDSRFGDVFDPPTSHLGKPLAHNQPLDVARQGIAYIRGMVAEAESMAQKTSNITDSKG